MKDDVLLARYMLEGASYNVGLVQTLVFPPEETNQYRRLVGVLADIRCSKWSSTSNSNF